MHPVGVIPWTPLSAATDRGCLFVCHACDCAITASVLPLNSAGSVPDHYVADQAVLFPGIRRLRQRECTDMVRAVPGAVHNSDSGGPGWPAGKRFTLLACLRTGHGPQAVRSGRGPGRIFHGIRQQHVNISPCALDRRREGLAKSLFQGPQQGIAHGIVVR